MLEAERDPTTQSPYLIRGLFDFELVARICERDPLERVCWFKSNQMTPLDKCMAIHLLDGDDSSCLGVKYLESSFFPETTRRYGMIRSGDQKIPPRHRPPLHSLSLAKYSAFIDRRSVYTHRTRRRLKQATRFTRRGFSILHQLTHCRSIDPDQASTALRLDNPLK